MSTETRTNSGLDNVTKLESPTEWLRFRREMADYLHIQGYGRLFPGGDEAEDPAELDGLTEAEQRKERRA